MGRVLRNSKGSSRLIKWTMELSEYEIQYHPCTTIKAQALANFLIEVIGDVKEEVWKIFVDESSMRQGSDVGVWLLSPQGEELSLKLQITM